MKSWGEIQKTIHARTAVIFKFLYLAVQPTSRLITLDELPIKQLFEPFSSSLQSLSTSFP